MNKKVATKKKPEYKPPEISERCGYCGGRGEYIVTPPKTKDTQYEVSVRCEGRCNGRSRSGYDVAKDAACMEAVKWWRNRNIESVKSSLTAQYSGNAREKLFKGIRDLLANFQISSGIGVEEVLITRRYEKRQSTMYSGYTPAESDPITYEHSIEIKTIGEHRSKDSVRVVA